VNVLDDLLAALPESDVPLREVQMGPFWTLVWTERGAGLASTQRDSHTPHAQSLVRGAGGLLERSAHELAGLVRSRSPMEAGLGMATINALLTPDPAALSERNAAAEILQRGAGKRVVIVGHFPFIPQVRRAAGHLDVLELDPSPGELPARAAGEVIPHADVVAITGTSLLNRSFDGLMAHCRPGAFVLLLGPTAPLSPVLFDYGVDVLAGTQVIDPETALRHASQGAIFRQMRGVRLVTLTHES
jgi:uncharacterized protein (DUF4213/DUF364 family)